MTAFFILLIRIRLVHPVLWRKIELFRLEEYYCFVTISSGNIFLFYYSFVPKYITVLLQFRPKVYYCFVTVLSGRILLFYYSFVRKTITVSHSWASLLLKVTSVKR